eukprot:1154264-Pelagomonas_calceolata.AAC.10
MGDVSLLAEVLPNSSSTAIRRAACRSRYCKEGGSGYELVSRMPLQMVKPPWHGGGPCLYFCQQATKRHMHVRAIWIPTGSSSPANILMLDDTEQTPLRLALETGLSMPWKG